MARHTWAVGALALALVAGAGSEARADITLTGFVGTTTTPAARPARGVAVGVGVLVVGVEFEYAMTSDDVPSAVPSLRTGMVNLLVQTPVSIGRVQLYGTIGGGVYREVLEDQAETSVGINYGGGVRVTIAGPLRVRVDYRLFHLRGSPRMPDPQRFYVGLGVSF